MSLADNGHGPTPSIIAYQDIASKEVDRVYGFVFLLVGDRPKAEEITLEAFRRTWEGFRRGRVVDDAAETLYRWATRISVNRLGRSKELRGHQPPTTAEDREITAMGIVSGFAPQQRAGVLLAVWGGLAYRVAGIASALGERRVGDVTFAARQEYRHARSGRTDRNQTCQEIGPLLSAHLDNEGQANDRERVEAHLAGCEACQHTERMYREFGAILKAVRIAPPISGLGDAAVAVPEAQPSPRVRGARELRRLAAGPALLVLVLIAAVVIFRDCGEPSIKTGVGRTSDLIYAQESSATLVIDAGSGREIGRLDAGVLTQSGHEVYGTRRRCRGRGDATTIWKADTGTLQAADVGCADGRLAAIAVDEDADRLYLGDEAADWGRLVVFDLKQGTVAGSLSAPPMLADVFRPDRAILATDRRSLFSYGALRDSMSPAVAWFDLPSARAPGWVALDGAEGGAVSMVASVDGQRVFVYDLAEGRLHEVDLERSRIGRSTSVGASGPVASGEPASRALVRGALAASPDGAVLYAVLPEGGIAVVGVDRLEVAGRLGSQRRYKAIAASTDGRMLYGLEGDGTYVVLDESTGEPLLRRARVRGSDFLQVNAGE